MAAEKTHHLKIMSECKIFFLHIITKRSKKQLFRVSELHNVAYPTENIFQ